MWVRIDNKIPVNSKVRPILNGVYWAEYTNPPSKDSLVKAFEKLSRESYMEIDVDVASFNHRKRLKGITKKKKEMINYLENIEFYCDELWGQKIPIEILKKTIVVVSDSVCVYPHECTILTSEEMKDVCEVTHELIEGNFQKRNISLTELQRSVRDAGLVDGCTEYQALLLSIGEDIDADFPPPVGWFKPKNEYFSGIKRRNKQ